MRMDTCVTCLCALKMWLWVSVVLYDNSLSRLLSGEGAKVRLVVSFTALFTRVGWGSGLYVRVMLYVTQPSAVPDFTNVHIILLSQQCHNQWRHNTVLVLPILLVRRVSLCYVCKLRLKVRLIRKKLQKLFSCWSQSDHVETCQFVKARTENAPVYIVHTQFF